MRGRLPLSRGWQGYLSDYRDGRQTKHMHFEAGGWRRVPGMMHWVRWAAPSTHGGCGPFPVRPHHTFTWHSLFLHHTSTHLHDSPSCLYAPALVLVLALSSYASAACRNLAWLRTATPPHSTILCTVVSVKRPSMAVCVRNPQDAYPTACRTPHPRIGLTFVCSQCRSGKRSYHRRCFEGHDASYRG
jgi:hypothetical protein